MEKRVSLKDIANKVGVSIALVSYVMNGQEKKKRVGAEVVKKIRKAAEDLNYQPNQIARSLRTGSTKTIGLIVADIANPFFGHLARIIEDEANNFGYTVVFGSSDENDFKSEALVNTLLNRQVDGFIIVPAQDTVVQMRTLIKKKFPVVFLDRYFPELNASYIVLDNYQATFEATHHLFHRGYRRIALLAYKSSMIHMKERIRGYAEAMELLGLKENCSIHEIRFEHSQKDMEAIFSDLIVDDKKADAIICATNALSVSALISVKKNNIIIPDDMAMIGFDGGECFDLYHSPLTYVKQPMEEMGKEAFRVLLDLINGSSKTSHIILHPTLIIRNSS
jgi:LacI family transcriptional regulator